ncbi:DUF5683 domain-containing protein [Robiginitalea aurantiaca]|uniref:DUF5683 domain-containing protein n=1 Tax=Robiginitalea aurantiaca TaxID=3056915 RepID=A0ABT7WGL9_9FLAO|nr:DUF5683 domain-containing protein [Robiginitalea aurantiaca]MDM9632069.1 DUF5683 domain-containing protein [Robiginitalea aurantiaca]
MPKLLLVLGFFCALTSLWAQEESPTEREIDSIQNNISQQGITVEEVTKKPANNPLAPSKAAFYSAVVPGLGQAYNKRYWKIPIVWGAIGTGVYAYMYNDDLYDRTRTAFKRRLAGFTDDEFYDVNPDDDFVPTTPDFSTEALQDAQERYQRDRDLALLITIALYALNIIDANVDAHLKQYNVSEDLSLHFEPYLGTHPINTDASYGLGLAIRF